MDNKFIRVVAQVRTKGAGLMKYQIEVCFHPDTTPEERTAYIHARLAREVEVWYADMAADESLSNVADWHPLNVKPT